ncbi:unnamed protein product [Pocillopora meandrina]|uniref:Uncharacterized protein n=1 Tax=Pocillopora meandrina TaxID=46732 RepID=A0AAU9X408_9CNID|nr:unnamed protein product [Pocillopora meandrina]
MVPTGNYKQLCLPECENWPSDLWIKCFNVMSIPSGLAFVKINEGRLKYPDSSPTTTSTNENQSGCNPGANDDIPRQIPLNQEQENGLLKRIWKAFLDGCGAFKNFTYGVLRYFFSGGN